MTIYWTSDDCDGQAILTLHLSVGQVILFPYFDHCTRSPVLLPEMSTHTILPPVQAFYGSNKWCDIPLVYLLNHVDLVLSRNLKFGHDSRLLTLD